MQHSQIGYGRGRASRIERDRSFLGFLVVVSVLVFLIFTTILARSQIDAAMRRVEKVECETWKAQAALYPGFYLVGWQADQCKAVGVPMPGIPVKE